ncbi:MAG: glycosyltransferase 87 family protein, partial [Nanoarchaeota archaeon]
MLKDWRMVAVLVTVTTVFVIQHYMNFSWDFNSYLLNAQYWFSDGIYFEPYRPPLMPIALGMLSVLGWNAASYMYVVLGSLLVGFASWQLARSTGLDPFIFYVFLMSPYALVYGMFNGTELVSLAFLLLAVVRLLKRDPMAGLFLALAALLRYSYLPGLVLLIFLWDWKRILKGVTWYAAALFPWLLYNMIKYGNWFASIADQYAMNMVYRHYINQPFRWQHIDQVIGPLYPFLLLGVLSLIVYLAVWRQQKTFPRARMGT